jgi:hypothetical protein
MRSPTRKETAEAYRLAVIHGVVPPRRAVEWADGVLARDAVVDPSMLDLASAWSRGAGDVVSALNAVPGDADPSIVLRLFLLLVDERLTADPGHAEATAKLLFDLVIYGDGAGQELQDDIYYVDDCFEQARLGGACTLLEACAEVSRVVRAHRADAID